MAVLVRGMEPVLWFARACVCRGDIDCVAKIKVILNRRSGMQCCNRPMPLLEWRNVVV